jgi:hypothetical protein
VNKETIMSAWETSPFRITAIEWCIGCKEWFSDKQITENLATFATFEAERPHDSIIFIHEGCVEHLKAVGVLFEPTEKSETKGGGVFIVSDNPKEE